MVVTSKKLAVLALVAVILLVVTGYLYGGSEKVETAFVKGEVVIQGLDATKVEKIELTEGKNKVTLTKVGAGFVVAQSSNYPAAASKINDLLVRMMDARAQEKITEDPANYKELKVADDSTDAVKVVLYGPDNKVLTGLYLGKGSKRGGRYVRTLKGKIVYATEKPLHVAVEDKAYLETALISLGQQEIAKVECAGKEGTYTLVEGTDKAKEPVLVDPPAGRRAKKTQVGATFRAGAFISFEKVMPADKAKIDWDRRVKVFLKNHLTYVIDMGKYQDAEWIKVVLQGPDKALVEKSARISKTESKEELAKKDAILTAAQKATDFNKLAGGWVYQIPPWKSSTLYTPLDLMTEEDKPEEPKEVRVSHILVSYQGALKAETDRTKEEARKLAEELDKHAKAPGADFAALAKQHSNGPSAANGGDLGKFGKGKMTPAFEKAAFGLKVGQVSDVVETPFGFHIIKRTE